LVEKDTQLVNKMKTENDCV